MGNEVRFDLKEYLETMRAEQRADHAALSGKVDGLRTEVAEFSVRLTIVEQFRKSSIWFYCAAGVAALGLLVDLAKNHFGFKA